MKQFALVPVLLALALAAPCVASDFSDRYPAGSLKTREDSKAALVATREESARLGKELKAREAECLRDVFVNSCREAARKEHDLAQRNVRRVEVEAKDLGRRLDAEELARRKEKAAADEAVKAPLREKRAAESKATVERREAEAATKTKGITPEEAAKNVADHDAKVKAQAAREAERRAEAPQRAANAAEYERKQAEAARHAKEQEIERKKREERRAQREQARAKQEAAREAVRAKAEEAAAAAKN